MTYKPIVICPQFDIEFPRKFMFAYEAGYIYIGDFAFSLFDTGVLVPELLRNLFCV